MARYQLKPATHFTMSLPTRTLLLYSGARSRRIEEERRLTALGDTALDVLELDVVGVVGLDIGSETVEGALDGFLGGRVHHAGLFNISQHSFFSAALHGRISKTYVLRGIVRCPANKGNLAPRALTTVKLVLDIEDGIAATDALLATAVLALGVEELLAEDVKVCLLGRLFDDNLFPVITDLVDYPLDVFAELKLVEGADALGRDGDTADLVSTCGTGLDRGSWGVRYGDEGVGMCGRGCRAATAICIVFVRRAVRTRIEPASLVNTTSNHACSINLP